jgi:hypothetical protein
MTGGRDRVACEETIARWRKRLEAAPSDDAFEALWAEAWAWITGPASAAIDDLLDEGEEWKETLAPFQRRSLGLAEAREAERLMASEWSSPAPVTDRVRSDFGRHTYDRVPEVLRLADFASCRRFVMVGCGAFPAAALLVRDATEVPEIVAIDVDDQAAAIARRVIAAMSEPRIRIDCGDGAAFDYGGADIVYLANQVSGKSRVLKRVRDTARSDAVVVVRDPSSVGRLVAEHVEPQLPPPYRVGALGEGNPDFYSRHVLLARDGN